MADNAHLYNLHATYATFKGGAGIPYDANAANGSAHVGKAVRMSGDGEVDLTAAGSEVVGKLTKVEPDGFVTVQDGGYTDLPSSGTINYASGLNAIVGSATAGVVATGASAAAATATRRAYAVKSDGTNRIIARF